MAVGYRSLAGFPLGAGVTNVPPPATVGFKSLFWWMGGFSPVVVQEIIDYHDGKPRRSVEEIQRELYLEQKQALRETIARRFRGEEPELPAPIVAEKPSKPLPRALLDALNRGNDPLPAQIEPLPSLQDVVSRYREIERELQRVEDEEIGLLLAMGLL